MKNDPLIFELKIAKNKPSTFRKDKSSVCPFCDVENLVDIYKQKNEMIWLHNRFPTLRNTLQTVLRSLKEFRFLSLPKGREWK